MDREHWAHGLVPKDSYLYALCRNVQQRLCHDPPSHDMHDSDTPMQQTSIISQVFWLVFSRL